MNLEGRVQRLRRAVLPPVPDELAWLSALAARFGVEVSPHPAVVYAELSGRILGGLGVDEVDEQAPLTGRAPYTEPTPATTPQPQAPESTAEGHLLGELRLLRYRPLFSGPQVERVPELQFQRPEPVVELSPTDADRRAISTGDRVLLRSNGTSVELRARVDRRLLAGVARVAEEHAGELHRSVEVVKL
jgi:predicted molibdopterin-dependent oxidoreductase YjgC